jgi:Zn-dependent protease
VTATDCARAAVTRPCSQRRANARHPVIGKYAQCVTVTRARHADGLLVGMPLGIPVRVSPWWPLVLVVAAVIYEPVVTPRFPDASALARFGAGAVLGLVLYACVAAHELGHALVARRVGLTVTGIALRPLVGLTRTSGQVKTPAAELAVAIVGPAVNLVVGGITLAVVRPSSDGSWQFLLANIAVMNVGLGLFNLIPGLPFDGGRALRALIWWVSGRKATATRIAGWLGRFLALPLAAIGVRLLMTSTASGRAQGTTVAAVALVMTALGVFTAASASLQEADALSRAEKVSAGTLARMATVVPEGTSLSAAARTGAARNARVLVLAQDGSWSLLDEARARLLPEHRWPWTIVDAFTRPIDQQDVVESTLSGDQLLSRLADTTAPVLLVLSHGALVGVVDVDSCRLALFGRSRPSRFTL